MRAWRHNYVSESRLARTQGMDRTIYCDADSLWLSDAAALWAEFDAMEATVLFGMTEENAEPDGRCLWYSEGARVRGFAPGSGSG